MMTFMQKLKQKAIEITEQHYPKHLETITEFFNNYCNSENRTLDKLNWIHDFVQSGKLLFNENPNWNDIYDIFNILFLTFNDENINLSELYTILIVTKPFREEPKIKDNRDQLLQTMRKVRANIETTQNIKLTNVYL